MIFSKTEKYFIQQFKIYPYDRELNGARKIKKVTLWILFVPIISYSKVVEQVNFPVR